MNLFNEDKPTFQKVAEEIKLDDNTDLWQAQVASEAYRQNPFLSDYAVDVMLEKVDDQKGYGFGKIKIRNKFDEPKVNGNDKREAFIPIIVQQKLLKPLNLLTYKGKTYPLTDDKLEGFLFRPESVELSDRNPARDKSIDSQNYAPMRGGSNSFSYSYDDNGKYASILDQLEISVDDKIKLGSDLTLSSFYINSYSENPSFRNCIEKIANSKKKVEIDAPDVVQFHKISQKRVLVKWANVENFNVNSQEVNTSQAAAMAGERADEVYKIEPNDSITVTTVSAKKTQLTADTIMEVKDFGEYKVQDADGKDLMGWVIPVIDFNMIPLPAFIFTNGSNWCYQDRIAGSKIGMGTNLPQNLISGNGVFYFVDSGKVMCTLPVEILSKSGDQIMCMTNLGDQISLTQTECEAIMQIDKTSYAIPRTMKFMRLPEDEIVLRYDPITIEKTASERGLRGSFIEIEKFADRYSVTGDPIGVDGSDLPRSDAEFLLAAAGFDGKEVLANVDENYYLRLGGAQRISKGIQKKASMNVDYLKRDLLKEAAAIPDEDTVDKVLSLKYINGDNVHKFISFLPELQETEHKLADLLLYSRCGLSTVPEEAAESAMRNIGEVIQGLQRLKEKKSAKGL